MAEGDVPSPNKTNKSTIVKMTLTLGDLCPHYVGKTRTIIPVSNFMSKITLCTLVTTILIHVLFFLTLQ